MEKWPRASIRARDSIRMNTVLLLLLLLLLLRALAQLITQWLIEPQAWSLCHMNRLDEPHLCIYPQHFTRASKNTFFGILGKIGLTTLSTWKPVLTGALPPPGPTYYHCVTVPLQSLCNNWTFRRQCKIVEFCTDVFHRWKGRVKYMREIVKKMKTPKRLALNSHRAFETKIECHSP